MKFNTKQMLAAAAFSGFAMMVMAAPVNAEEAGLPNENAEGQTIEETSTATKKEEALEKLNDTEVKTDVTFTDIGGTYDQNTVDYLTQHTNLVVKGNADLKDGQSHIIGQVYVGGCWKSIKNVPVWVI